MPHFVIHCLDKPGALPTRRATREAHLAYIRGTGVVRLAGPLHDEAGEMAGSLLIVEVPDLAAAQAFNAADPYVAAGVFESVDIRAIKVTIGEL
jgi:uncharacterized protein YciI